MTRKPTNPMTLQEIERAKALSALGKSYHAIGLELDRDSKTIKKHLTKPQVAKDIKELKKEIASLYEDLSQQILRSITCADIKEAKLRDRVISAGVCTDKARLLNDESTANISEICKFIVVHNSNLTTHRDDQENNPEEEEIAPEDDQE